MKCPYLFGFIFLLFIVSCSSSSMSDSSNTDINMMPSVEEEPSGEGEMNGDNNTSSYSGDFVSSAHPTSGKATVNSEHTFLNFTNFKTDNGPVLEVYLATNTSANTYISLGTLKGVDGNYQYALPNNIDYTVYNHVLIWCVEYSVNFGYAVLE